MSISTLFSGINPLYSTSAATSTGTTAAADSDGDHDGSTSVSNGSTSTSLSSGAQLLKQLEQLSTSNPTEFKAVTANIATQLQAQATQDGGQQGQALSALAAKFQTASQTGSAAGLVPQHHHHHGGGSGSSDSSLSSSLLTALSASSDTSSSTGSGASTSTGSNSSAAATAAAAYQAFSGQSLGSQINSIISDALSQYTVSGSTSNATTTL